jgi:restriction system protein
MPTTVTRLQRIDPHDFEHFIADLWDKQGWRTNVTPASNDGGIDVRATKGYIRTEKWAFQVKRYGPNTTVGAPAIQQYASLPHQYAEIDRVAVITSNRFTKPAEEAATTLNVTLIDGDELVTRCHRYGSSALISKYDADVSWVRATWEWVRSLAG